jgi:hypothetical protein
LRVAVQLLLVGLLHTPVVLLLACFCLQVAHLQHMRCITSLCVMTLICWHSVRIVCFIVLDSYYKRHHFRLASHHSI